MRIIKTADYDAMSKKAADIIAAQMIMKEDSVLGLATGSSPIGTYKELVKMNMEGRIDFSKITTVNLDEYRGLPRSNDQSYYYFMNDNLFNHVNIDKERTHVPNGMVEDAEKECADYEALIKEVGGVDLQLLGLGHNGHIGFNEPGTPFGTLTHVAELAESTVLANARFFDSMDEVPRVAATMGIKSVMNARSIIMVILGSAKAEIAKAALQGPVTEAVPASVLQLHPSVTWYVDHEAAKLL